MRPQHIINLAPETYNLLEEIAENREVTINEVIVQLVHKHHETIDLTTGLDAVPSILVNKLETISDS